MEISDELVKKLQRLAWDNRLLTMKMFHESGQGGHYGGSFSSAEILTVLYSGGVLKVDPKNPKWKKEITLFSAKATSVVCMGQF